MQQTDTLIIIGRSEIVTPDLLREVSKLKGVKVGINKAYKWADYYAHIDQYPNNKPPKYGKCKPLTLKCFNVPNSESYELQTGDTPVIDGKLKYCGFTHDFVLSWAILKGFKKVLLVGVADFATNKHNTGTKFNPSESCIIESIEYINSLPIDIYTVNPNSKLSVNKITRGELKLWQQYQQK